MDTIESRLKEAELEHQLRVNELLTMELDMQRTIVKREKVRLERDELKLEREKNKVDVPSATLGG